MKLELHEDPREWRKDALLAAGGMAVFTSLLHWRRHLPDAVWLGFLLFAAMAAVCACLAPRCFRGYSHFTRRLGFRMAYLLGLVVLGVFFFLVLTPVGLVLRIFGQDPLALKFRTRVDTYWRPARKSTSLDSLF